MCHYLRGWSHLGHYVNHLRGCPLAPRDSHPTTCLRTTYAELTPPTWQSPSDTTIGHNQANVIIHPVTGKEMEYSALMKYPRLQLLWTRGFGNEYGRLFQGIRDIPGTDTCLFIELKNIPNDRKITYGKIVCDYKPHKKEKERVRLTVGGDILDYSGDVATSTADITTFKILINSTLSTKDAAMTMMDIKNYYLGTPLPRFEYMKMLLSRFPEEIVQKYNLNALAIDGWVYIEIRKGMYGLKQAGLLANQLLQTRLAPFGYYPARHTPGLWLHNTRPISFTLVVDDFAVKYVGKQHAEHLRNALLQTYELTTDWTATVYSGMTLKWDYKKQDMQHLHARLRFQRLKQISTRRPQASTTYPITVCHACLWRQDPICHEV
jgi:hypothetical protein